ncbi:hypothetical protein L1987_79265 [Smallanthus sonchifolius]|uniref:Uncharacterized protein n=1 Tax=Smallanthus sonchifolius TaxID=185202 RepID=A0ACB8ZE77_9ASTR|nr:hypothetical protein L1987_79265 [Smallanthus sonchifolius]
MSSLMFYSLAFFLCSCFTLSNGASDPNSIYKSFLQCLPAQSSKPDPSISTIVYGSVTNSSSYTAVLQAYIKNSRLNTTSTPKPAVIITPTKESHVQAAVLCARKLGVQIKIRSGGHDYEGISYISSEKNFVVLDMFNFRTVNVNIATETAVVEGGAQLGELYYRIWEKSKVHGFPAGIQYSVNWNEGDPKPEQNYLNQSRVLYKFMTEYVSKNPRGAFLNYRDLDIGVMKGTGKSGYNSGKVYGEKYFMGNFDRLAKVKTAVDPGNFFRNEQSIPVIPGSKSRKMTTLN